MQILRKDGFKVRVYPNDHEPAHVHVYKAGMEMRVDISSLEDGPEPLDVQMDNKNALRALRLMKQTRVSCSSGGGRYMSSAPFEEAQMLDKLSRAKMVTEASAEPRAVEAWYDEPRDMVVVCFDNGTEFGFPRQLGQGLAKASPQQLAKVRVTPLGTGLQWETLDVDLSIPHLIQGFFGMRQWMSELGKRGGASKSSAKARAARSNGKKGGRPPQPNAREE
ncbi:protein of unknown function (DUF3532) [Rubidibacter lacunae KORDI 51-2]|uniref:DUF2442 domain-containing protein n=1 Tax=Rubidibacter lacunae KORDI 51-2 TaxID=582515 RepID=U5DFQ1_9CHRO|nr:DUF2442 domain-containing protein [Rubidibacter lacunae]ERN40426.1 protein of unknown function (DUF3532) [Rubidibacter lacunae KORDI 51-2]